MTDATAKVINHFMSGCQDARISGHVGGAKGLIKLCFFFSKFVKGLRWTCPKSCRFSSMYQKYVVKKEFLKSTLFK